MQQFNSLLECDDMFEVVVSSAEDDSCELTLRDTYSDEVDTLSVFLTLDEVKALRDALDAYIDEIGE